MSKHRAVSGLTILALYFLAAVAHGYDQDLPPDVRDFIDVFTNQVVLRNTLKERKKKMCAYSVNKQKHQFIEGWSKCMHAYSIFMADKIRIILRYLKNTSTLQFKFTLWIIIGISKNVKTQKCQHQILIKKIKTVCVLETLV